MVYVGVPGQDKRRENNEGFDSGGDETPDRFMDNS